MLAAWQKHLALWLVFALGVAAGVYGVYLVVIEHGSSAGAVEALGGLALVAWVLFHPARAATSR